MQIAPTGLYAPFLQSGVDFFFAEDANELAFVPPSLERLHFFMHDACNKLAQGQGLATAAFIGRPRHLPVRNQRLASSGDTSAKSQKPHRSRSCMLVMTRTHSSADRMRSGPTVTAAT